MLDGTYTLEVDTSFGKKKGTICLSTQGSSLVADIDVPIVGKQHLTGTADGDSFTAEGSVKVFLMGQIDYTVSGKTVENTLYLNIRTSKGDLSLEGTRV